MYCHCSVNNALLDLMIMCGSNVFYSDQGQGKSYFYLFTYSLGWKYLLYQLCNLYCKQFLNVDKYIYGV
jgi:hypothetical protein